MLDKLQITETMSLDFYTNNIKTINVKQYDTNARFIHVSFTEQGKKVSLNQSTMSVIVRFKKSDGKFGLRDCEILEDGSVLIELTEQMTVVSGKAQMDVMILEESGIKADSLANITSFEKCGIAVLSTMPLYLNVIATPIQGAELESEYDFTTLNKSLAASLAIEIAENGKFDESGNLIEDGRVQVEKKRVDAETARNEAEALRNIAENGKFDEYGNLIEDGRVQNEQQRIEAEDNRVEAETQRNIAENGKFDEYGNLIEGGRVQAEQQRVEAEIQREKNVSNAIKNCEEAIVGIGVVMQTEKGVADGVASLDETGKIPLEQIPDGIQAEVDWNATEVARGAIQNKPPIEKGEGENSLTQSEEVDKNLAIGNHSVAFGKNNIAGSKAYYISALDFKNRKIYLSNTQVVDAPPTTTGEVDTSFETPAYEVGKQFNIVVPDDHYILCGTIESIENNVVTYTEDSDLGFTKFMSLKHLQERFETTEWSEICSIDDYTFAVPSQPLVGIVVITGSEFVEGGYNIAAGSFSHAEGAKTFVAGNFGHAEGQRTTAGYSAHAEGNGATALGKEAHAEGYRTNAMGDITHAEGRYTIASGYASHAEGNHTNSSGGYSHAEGSYTSAEGKQAHSEGLYTVAKAVCSHAEGYTSLASGTCAHAEGIKTSATGEYSHAEGASSEPLPTDFTDLTTDEQIIARWGTYKFLLAKGPGAHAEGLDTLALGEYSHAEGYRNIASGTYSHAEGRYATASGYASHAEGNHTTASGSYSHAEGYFNNSEGKYSHTENSDNTAIGIRSHAQGYNNTTSAFASHVEGQGNIINVKGNSSHVQGKYNLEDTSGTYAHIVGGGNSDTPSNLHTIRWKDGQGFFRGGTTTEGADYAEYFEWLDGNPDGEDRVGLLVTLDGEKIKLANADDEILGIISGTAAVLGDNYECEWNGKYLTDVFGRIQYEMVEEFYDEIVGVDEETNEPITEKQSLGFFKHPVLNPDYDPCKEYVNRGDRPEWDAVGMLGKMYVRDDGTCQVNGYATIGENGKATASNEKTNMRVLSRVNENVVRVLLK